MLSGIVITKNESSKIAACLKSLAFCDELIVVDNGSTDLTSKIAQNFGAKIYKNYKTGDFSVLRNFGLAKAKGDWVLYIDADEEVSSALQSEIKLAITNSKYQSYYVPRTDSIWGHNFRFGDLKDFRIVRLAQKKAGIWIGKIHETWQVTGGVGSLRSPIIHYPHPSLYEFLDSINRYSSIRATELHDQHVSTNIWQIILYPLGKFVNLWIYKLGFLDGTPGLIHALTMSFYTYLVRSKLYFIK